MLLLVLLFWVVLFVGMALFGYACIKWGTYTSQAHDERPTLTV